MSIYDVAFDFKDVDIDKFREILLGLGHKYEVRVCPTFSYAGPSVYRYGEVKGGTLAGRRSVYTGKRVVSMRQVIMQASPLWGGSMATILGLDELQNLSTALDNAG